MRSERLSTSNRPRFAITPCTPTKNCVSAIEGEALQNDLRLACGRDPRQSVCPIAAPRSNIRGSSREEMAMEKADFYRDARQDLPGPLAGIRVLEATTSWAGPMCGCVLADLGADVIKVEDPAGEVGRRIPPFLPGATRPISFLQATVNRNKRSLTLDLRTPQGREIFLKLTRQADIVLQNFPPGTFDRWEVGYAACREVKPDIIYVSISGFGQFGPIHDRVGYDPLAQAMSGFMSLNGPVEGGPSKAPTF